jgi:alpha-1,3-rhamnosyl/mannosyltransferase
MACGCPVICGENGALRETGGDAALYVGVHSPREIAAAMDGLAGDPGLALTHSLRGYKQAQQFTWQGMAAKVAEVIRGMI